MAFSEDGKQLMSINVIKELMVLEAGNQKWITHPMEVIKWAAFSPNGNLVAYETDEDDKEILETDRHDLRIWPELVLIVGTKLAISGARSIQ